MKLVSVVIPTYNRAEMLRNAVLSVLNQTYKNIECIVVDDNSTDNTAEVVKQFNEDRVVYLKHDRNKHASAARNTGIRNANGEYVAFLDDDDEWLPTKLEKQVPILDSAPSKVGVVYCWMDYFDEAGRLVKEHHPTYKGYVFPKVLDMQRIGGCPTLLVRRSVVNEVGGFDETLPRGNDGDFVRRVCLRYEVDLIPEVLVKVHIGHLGRISSNTHQGHLNAIKGQQIKFEKFKDVMHKYPIERAAIYASMAASYIQLKDYKNSVRYYFKSIVSNPGNKHAYKKLLYSFRSLLINRN